MKTLYFCSRKVCFKVWIPIGICVRVCTVDLWAGRSGGAVIEICSIIVCNCINVSIACIAPLLNYCIAVSLHHCIIGSLYHCIVVSLYRCFIVSLYHCIIVSSYHCITADGTDLDQTPLLFLLTSESVNTSSTLLVVVYYNRSVSLQLASRLFKWSGPDFCDQSGQSNSHSVPPFS